MSERLYIGIDLGTYQSTIASSNGDMTMIETVVGKPKDPVARNMLGRDTLFGMDALKNKMACNIFRPLESGVAQDDAENMNAAKSFVTHLIETVNPDEFDEVYGVICSPSNISFSDKTNIVSILRGQVNAIMVVSEPFASAFGLGEISGSVVIDMGAGTTDIARICGTFPEESDEITVEYAGDWLDLELARLIEKKYTGAQVTKDMVRKWKEEFAYMGESSPREHFVDLSVEGKNQTVDIGDLVQIACESIIPHIVNVVKKIIAEADPEYQATLRNNIIVTGGVSQIEGMDKRLSEELMDIGNVSVSCARTPLKNVAVGALALAQAMPDEEYTAIN